MSAAPVKKLLRPFPLWPAQVDFLDARTTVKGFVGGIGSGKSRVGAYDLLSRVKDGRHYVVTGPTYKVLRDATCVSFTEVARHCGVLLKPIGGEAVSATVRPFAGGEATVLFRSTENPDLLRGPNLSGVWMDEASLSGYDAYQNLLGRLREASELGWLTCTFTPKGRTHWTFTEVFGKQPPRPDVTLVRARTRDNPFVPEDYLKTVEANFAGLLALQELGGEFVSVEGAEWPPEYFGDGIWFRDWPLPAQMQVKILALDPSKGKESKTGDYAAYTMLLVDMQGTLWVEAHLMRGQSAEVLTGQAVDYCRQWRPDVFVLETNQSQYLFSLLINQEAAKQGWPMPMIEIDNRVNKLVRIRRLGSYLQAGRIRFRDTPGTRLLVDQLMEFPEGPHDDGPDSLEMALRTAADLLADTEEGGQTVAHT